MSTPADTEAKNLPFGMKDASFFILGVLCLMGAALYNYYPLVTSDTGTYINSAFTFEVARDRPLAYSLLILVTSLKFSLWTTVAAQSLLIYYLINRVVCHLFGEEVVRKGLTLLIVIVVAMTTQVSWYTSQIMPDIFTAVGAMSLWIFLYDHRRKWLHGGLFLFAMAAHSSHLLIFLILVLFLVLIFKRRKLTKIYWAGAIIVVFAWLFVPTLHKVFGGKFSTNESFHVFMTGRLIETGTLQRYLRNNCPDETLPLCGYQDQLPRRAIDFIWDGNSALNATGGWEDENGEYRKMVRHILTNPKYVLQFLYSSFFSSLSQLTQTDVGDGLVPQVENSNPFWKVQQFYRYELPQYLTNRQNTEHLKYDVANHIYQWMAYLSLLFLVYHLIYLEKYRTLSEAEKALIFIFIGTIVVNAFVTATFGNVLARLQSRVVWLLPMLAVIIFVRGRILGGVDRKRK